MLNFESNDAVLAACQKGDKKLVVYRGVVYDVSKFLDRHPGGRKILDPLIGKPIDKEFAEQEHSENAKTYFGAEGRIPQVGQVLDKDLAEKLEIEIDTEYKKSFFCSRKYLQKKLFTKEDPIMLHKTLGILSLLSFIYRYLYVFPMTGNLGFEGTSFDYLTLALHMALSSSSLIFHVLPQRILRRPLIIWEEYRLHTILFTASTISVSLFADLWPMQNNEIDNFALFAIVVAFRLVVDEVTNRYGPGDPNQTTVRGKHGHDQVIPRPITKAYAMF